MQLIISDPKNAKAFAKKIEDSKPFIGKKVGDTVQLSSVGLEGYEAKITGGSDKTGTPMRFDIPGIGRKKVYITTGPGFVPLRKGQRRRVFVRGNAVAEDIHQLNLKVTKFGSKSLEEYFPKAEKKEEEQKLSVKEEMVKKSLDSVDKVTAEEAAAMVKEIKKH
ncbi:MAG: 30S ribosomal protein S6e [Candidatus Diapherotrites archaeon]|nr:30S ribosomal protein S6e [Candidatus Diapherotrites archaeon]